MNGSIFYVIKEIIKKSVKQNWSNYRTFGKSWNSLFKTTIYIVYSHTLLPSLKIINEIMNELRKITNEIVGIFQVRILSVAMFQLQFSVGEEGMFSRGEVNGWDFFGREFPLGWIFSYNHFLHIMHLFIYYFVQDTCIGVVHVSNRLRFDTSFTFIFSFKNGISNEWNSLP